MKQLDKQSKKLKLGMVSFLMLAIGILWQIIFTKDWRIKLDIVKFLRHTNGEKMNELMNRLNLMDCMEGMKQFPDKYFELAIVDPPYGIGDFRVNCGVATVGIEKYKKIDWNEKVPDENYFKKLYRISKHQIIFGFQYYMQFIKAKGIIIHNKKIPYDWQDFSKLLPCKDGKYLCYTTRNAFVVGDFRDDRFWIPEGGGLYYNVSHWRPIPDPPAV